MVYDRDIREPLFMFLEERFGKARFLEEKRTGQAIADVVMVLEDKICGIEIKSDADTYARLASQVYNYDKVYNMNIVVVGSSHGMHIVEHVPEYWGIITVEETSDKKLDFYVLRKAMENPGSSLAAELELLWRPELAHIQKLNGMHKYDNKSKQFVREKILETVPKELLIKQICDELFERDYETILERINAYRAERGLKKRRKTRKRRTKHT